LILYNSEEVSKILGVNVSTIKRWSTSGKLKCIRTAGGHRKFEMQHLTEFIQQSRKSNTKINAFPLEKEEDSQISEWILKANFSQLEDYVRKQAIRCNRKKILDVLKGLFLSKVALYTIYDQLLTPLLHNIGDAWEKGQISTTEEHFASQSIKDSIIRLQGMIKLPEKKLGSVMVMNLENELHDIVLKMIDHILEYKGYKILFSGQLTQRLNLQDIFEDYTPKRLYISSTFIKDINATQKEFDQICQVASQNSVDVFVGGSGFDHLKFSMPAAKGRLSTFKELYEM